MSFSVLYNFFFFLINLFSLLIYDHESSVQLMFARIESTKLGLMDSDNGEGGGTVGMQINITRFSIELQHLYI